MTMPSIDKQSVTGQQFFDKFPSIYRVDQNFLQIVENGEFIGFLERLCCFFGEYADKKFVEYGRIKDEFSSLYCREDYVDFLAQNLSFSLPDICSISQKRMLVRYLYDIVYRNAGTANGIIRAILFFTGLIAKIKGMTSKKMFTFHGYCITAETVAAGEQEVLVEYLPTVFLKAFGARIKIHDPVNPQGNRIKDFISDVAMEDGRCNGTLVFESSLARRIKKHVIIEFTPSGREMKIGESELGVYGWRKCFKIGDSYIGMDRFKGNSVRCVSDQYIRATYCFVVDIYGECDDKTKKFIAFLVEYMSPASNEAIIRYNDSIFQIGRGRINTRLGGE